MIVIAATVGLMGAVHAQEPKAGKQGKMSPEVIAKFDTDGDGKLTGAEKKAARAEMREENTADAPVVEDEVTSTTDGGDTATVNTDDDDGKAMKMPTGKRKEMMLKKFDADGDGELSEAEMATAREERKKMLIEQYDTDKDGTLNETEKAEMMAAMKKKHDGHATKAHGKSGVTGDAEAPEADAAEPDAAGDAAE